MFKIFNLFIQNVKRIKMVDITPKDDVVILEGRNAQGKSSVLDAIEYALAGKNSLPPKPVRDGAETAEIRVDIGDFIVVRTWSKNGNSYLKIESKNGTGDVKSPQAFLDGIIGRLSFDPLKFATMTSSERIAELKTVARLDWSELEKKYVDAYNERTLVNRDMTRVKAALDSLATLPELKQIRGVNEIQLSLQDANVQNGLVAEKNAIRGNVMRDIKNLDETLDRIDEKIADLKSQINAAEDERTRIMNRRTSLVKDAAVIDSELKSMKSIDTTSLFDELAVANEQSLIKEKYIQRDKLKAEQQSLAKHLDALEYAMSDAKEKKSRMIHDAKMPVSGLTIDESDVYYNGQPFSQISDAQKIGVSMSIAIAQNPELKLVKINNGSLLDDETMKKILSVAKENNIQVWIERVANEPSGNAVFIEDGSVKEEN